MSGEGRGERSAEKHQETLGGDELVECGVAFPGVSTPQNLSDDILEIRGVYHMSAISSIPSLINVGLGSGAQGGVCGQEGQCTGRQKKAGTKP